MMWDYGDERWQMHDQDGTGWWMVIFMLVIVVAVVVAVIAVLRDTTPVTTSGQVATRVADPRAILQERFARGEIDEQDFRTRMRALDDSGPHAG
jgi:putative membrane protein